MSRDGERVIFDTQEPLLPEDTDEPGTIANPTAFTQSDVYERRGATLTVDSRDDEEIKQLVMEHTGGEGAHVVIDSI